MVTQTDPVLGRTIKNYCLTQVLNKGGNSTVYLGQCVDNPHEKVAIKVLKPGEWMKPEDRAAFQTRFAREAYAASQLRHEHILPIFSYGASDDIFYMVMPLISGGTLAERFAAQQGLMPFDEIVKYAEQLASALDYAHSLGVAHRDVKPSNILLDEQDNVCLADFGIAYLFGDGPDALTLVEGPGSTSLTGTAQAIGTPAYMAPEQITGGQVGPATDIYAFGVLLYFLVSGQLPFQGSTPLAIAMKHLHDAPPPPRLLRPELPAPAEAVILRALAKQPVERFVSAGKFVQAFKAGLTGERSEGLIPPQSNLRSHLSASLRQFLLVGLLAVLLLLAALAALVGGLTWAVNSGSQVTNTPLQHQMTPVTKALPTATSQLLHHLTDKGMSIAWNNTTVYGLQKGTEKVLWQYNLPSQIVGQPKVAPGKVYVYTANNMVYVLNASDGRLLSYYQNGSNGNGGGDDGGN
ncbi:MAG: hypothetical protein NVSMB27_32150 [Ktedonobacteraceae bacterium]